MSDANRTQSPPDTSDPTSTADRSLHSVSSTDIDSNDDIVRKVFEEKLQLNDHTNPTDAPASDDEYSDAVSDSLQPATDAETDAEAERRQREQTLSVEQLAENVSKANDIKTFGNLQFKNEEYNESLVSYTEGLDVCPLANSELRAVLLGNRSAAYMQLGNSAAALADASKALELKPDYMKVLLRRAKLYEDTDKLDESLQDFKRAVELDADCAEARLALVRLPPKIDERNEKLKEEMLGKLKDLGNMILRPFGLSTNNFQMKQDPSTGSYSVNFNQNQ